MPISARLVLASSLVLFCACPTTTPPPDGGAGGGGGGCTAAQTSCAGACVDTQSDPRNCGACANACPAGQVCAAGNCASTCIGAGGTLCNGACVNTATDGANCGACGSACGAGASCTAGTCVTACSGSQTRCGTGATAVCANTLLDPAHCGACGTACSSGEACVAGACALTCTGGTGTVCSGQCVNTRTDNANCGACGAACPAGQLCSSSVCAASCAAPLSVCGTGSAARCAELAHDPANCLTCNNACPSRANATATCSGGCAFACNAGSGDCDGLAANGCEAALNTVAHCGACDRACASGETCNAGACATPLTPAPPTASNFMWQGLQERFNGSTCVGAVTLAVTSDAVCYVAANGSLMCAGQVHTTNHGTSFAAAGQTGVDQVLLSSTVNSATGSALCVHKTDGTMWCRGDRNSAGQFGTGSTSPSATWVQWGGSTLNNIARIATGTWDQMCVLDQAGLVKCAGYNFGSSPVTQAGTGHVSMWISSFGTVAMDDAAVLRASQGRAACTVTSAGLVCSGTTYGTAGQVVDGNEVTPLTAQYDHCWLTNAGAVVCKDDNAGTTVTHFTGVSVIALGSSVYTDTLCAVGADGSLWCVGDNSYGKLGNGNTNPLTTDTRVAPPGTVRIGCP